MAPSAAPRRTSRGQGGTAAAVAVAVVLAVVASGCRDGNRAEGASPPIDPCRLFTPAEARSHMNVAPEDDIAITPPRGVSPPVLIPGLQLCQVLPEAGPQLFFGLSRDLTREAFAKYKRENPGLQPVKGLGDEAVSDSQTLVVLDGDLLFAVAFKNGARHGPERTRRLAAIGLPRARGEAPLAPPPPPVRRSPSGLPILGERPGVNPGAAP